MSTPTRRSVMLSLTLAAAAPLSSGPALAAPSSRRRLGVQTHFAQGESADLLLQLDRQHLAFDFVRDEIYWAHLQDHNTQEFDWAYCDAYVEAISRAGKTLLLALDWSNPVFHALRASPHPHAPRNGIYLPDTAEERAGFARYVLAVLQRYAKPGGARYRPGLFEAIEVWNEANGSWNGDFPVKPGPGGVPETLVALTREVHAAVRADRAFDDIPILGGACVRVPLNYARWLLDAGLGEVIDGFVVHPYESPAEALRDIAALRRMLDARGLQRVRIWATEFGNSHTPDAFLEMLAVLWASPVTGASYYLAQSHHAAEMGLLDARGGLTEIGRAFQLWAGRFEGVTGSERLPSQPKTYLLAFESSAARMVVAWPSWGRTRLRLAPGQHASDALGRPLATPGGVLQLDGRAAVIFGPGPVREELDGERPLADSFADFSTERPGGGWSYLGRRGAALQPLSQGSSQYGDFLTLPGAGPAQLDASGAHPGRAGAEPVAMVRRYTLARDAEVVIRGQVARAAAGGDGTGVSVQAGRTAVLPRTVLRDTRAQAFEQTLTLHAGEAIDFTTDPGPAGDLAFDRVEWRISLNTVGASAR